MVPYNNCCGNCVEERRRCIPCGQPCPPPWPPGLLGPTGPQGPAGPAGTILGSYASLEALQLAHPTGNPGDAYLVNGVLYVWDTATNTWKSVGNLIGPTGPAGSASTILGSYASLAALRLAHPTGNPGDAYLVDGVLYVWDTATNDWKSVGDLIGPTGPQGQAGASILDSYATLAELIQAHPTGTKGDAYLVDGVLYVWNEETASWQEIGSLLGPTGAAGATILDSYPSYAELVAAHPTGTAGDAYLAGGELYVWNADTGSWQNMGSLIGPTGPAGPNGNDGADGIIGQINGVVATTAELPTTEVEPGTLYYVEEDGGVYLYDGIGEWILVDLAQGPRGAIGPTGPTGPQGADGMIGQISGVVATVAELPATGIETGTLYYVEEDGGVYLYDGADGWIMIDLAQGPRGATGPAGPAGPAASAVAIIPFASQQAPHVGTNNAGEPVNVAPIGFGYMEYGISAGDASVALPIDVNDKSFRMSEESNRQVAFSVPFDMTINSLYITVGNWSEFPLPPTGTLVYPYVQLYAAPPASNTFLPIEGAVAKPEQGIDPASAAAATMRAASVDGLNINIRAGTRIAIGGMMEITGDTMERNYYLYFTGGIGMTRLVEETI